MKTQLCAVVGFAVATAAFATGASAEDRLATILARGKILVGTGSTNPPWHFKDDSGTLVGYDVDMGHLLAKAIFDDPEKVEYVIQGSDARIPNVLTDKVDITCQFMTVTAGRAQQVNFTIPYYREGVGLLLLKDGSKKSYEDLKRRAPARPYPSCRTSTPKTWCTRRCRKRKWISTKAST